MVKTNIVLLTYGNSAEHHRAVFCAMSFFGQYNDDLAKIRMIIYTDAEDFIKSHLSGFDIEYIHLNSQMLLNMLGGTTYIHRRKVEVIIRTFERYSGDSLLFVDSDTFFVSDPSRILNSITKSSSVMHIREYNFADGLALFDSFNQADAPRAFINFIEKEPLIIAGVSEYIDRNDYCWNSGVLGLHCSVIPLLDDVLKLTDDFYRHSSWFIAEQLAFSIVLSRRSDLIPSDSMVIHYWGKRQKSLMDNLLFNKLDELKQHLADKSYFRRLIKKWKVQVIDDTLKEKAVLALSQRSWKYGIKRLLIAICRNPTNIMLLAELRKP